MAEPTLLEVAEALAAQITTALAPTVEQLQVDARRIPAPTPPAIDIYPPDAPFYEHIAYGNGNVRVFFTVRARVAMGDNPAGQELLLSMMDPRSPQSIVRAILAGDDLGGLVDNVTVDPPSDYGYYTDPGSPTSVMLGCTWLVGVIL